MSKIEKVALLVFLMVPMCIMATTNDFGAASLNSQADKISAFLFGPTMRIAGVFGGAYGLLQAIITSSVRPLMLYGGIGLGANLIPKFIESVFSQGILIP